MINLTVSLKVCQMHLKIYIFRIYRNSILTISESTLGLKMTGPGSSESSYKYTIGIL